MKKRTFVIGIAICIIILCISLYYNQNNFSYSSSMCGSGMHGLRYMGLYYFSVIVIILLVFIMYFKKEQRICSFCKSNVHETWNVCPYCENKLDK
ncbi:hypothetical protein [Tepidibacter mesophilus]|uniref:hypothetical protein n=1 Tax=Tepidibacter mesophilus TaxID=655607 RepID=UPI000C07787F|nr:hypothetical protein [Tepidibacter mesophilus]